MKQFELEQDKQLKSPGELQKMRWGIGASILLQMDKENEKGESNLPLPNVRILSEVMQRIFDEDGYIDSLPESHKWRPTANYWYTHLADVRRVLRDEYKAYLEYKRQDGLFKGDWQFVDKKEYEAILAREYQGMSTRADNYNERLDDSKWQLRVPHIADIPRITAN